MFALELATRFVQLWHRVRQDGEKTNLILTARCPSRTRSAFIQVKSPSFPSWARTRVFGVLAAVRLVPFFIILVPASSDFSSRSTNTEADIAVSPSSYSPVWTTSEPQIIGLGSLAIASACASTPSPGRSPAPPTRECSSAMF